MSTIRQSPLIRIVASLDTDIGHSIHPILSNVSKVLKQGVRTLDKQLYLVLTYRSKSIQEQTPI